MVTKKGVAMTHTIIDQGKERRLWETLRLAQLRWLQTGNEADRIAARASHKAFLRIYSPPPPDNIIQLSEHRR